jgi:RNA polymerase sigma factor (sigma-70 family)
MSAIDFFLEHQESLNFVARKYTRCIADAEDVMQESAIKIWTNRESLESVSNARAWMMTIVKNTAIDMHRRGVYNKLVYDSDVVYAKQDVTDEPSDEYFRSIPIEVVNDAIKSLSDGYKRVATMYLLDGLSHKEISTTLNVAIGTSKSNLSKAKKNVIKYIQNKNT